VHAIGGDHKILNQFGRSILLAGIDSLHLAVRNDSLRLHAVDVQRAQSVPLVEEDLRRLILQS